MLTLRLFRALRAAIRQGRVKNKHTLRCVLRALEWLLRWAIWTDGPIVARMAICQAPARR